MKKIYGHFIVLLIGLGVGWAASNLYPNRRDGGIPKEVQGRVEDPLTLDLLTTSSPIYIYWDSHAQLFMAEAHTGGGGGGAFALYYSPITGAPLPKGSTQHDALNTWLKTRVKKNEPTGQP